MLALGAGDDLGFERLGIGVDADRRTALAGPILFIAAPARLGRRFKGARRGATDSPRLGEVGAQQRTSPELLQRHIDNGEESE